VSNPKKCVYTTLNIAKFEADILVESGSFIVICKIYDENGKVNTENAGIAGNAILNLIGLMDGTSNWSLGSIADLLIPSAGAEGGYYCGAGWNPGLGGLWRDPRFDLEGTGGTNSFQAMLAGLPARVEDAARAGVAEGISKITVTGNITTGNVVLDSGAVVGELTPKINMALGELYAVSYNDD